MKARRVTVGPQRPDRSGRPAGRFHPCALGRGVRPAVRFGMRSGQPHPDRQPRDCAPASRTSRRPAGSASHWRKPRRPGNRPMMPHADARSVRRSGGAAPWPVRPERRQPPLPGRTRSGRAKPKPRCRIIPSPPTLCAPRHRASGSDKTGCRHPLRIARTLYIRRTSEIDGHLGAILWRHPAELCSRGLFCCASMSDPRLIHRRIHRPSGMMPIIQALPCPARDPGLRWLADLSTTLYN